MKKLFSFALTAVLVMSVSTAVFAYSEPNCGGGGGGWGGGAVPKNPFPTVTPNNLNKPPIGGFFQLPLC